VHGPDFTRDDNDGNGGGRAVAPQDFAEREPLRERRPSSILIIEGGCRRLSFGLEPGSRVTRLPSPAAARTRLSTLAAERLPTSQDRAETFHRHGRHGRA
jgi:hypothetical protein